MGKTAILLILGSIFLFALVNYNMGRSMVGATESAADRYCETRARSIANTVTGSALSKLSDSVSLRFSTPRTMSLMGGSAQFSIIDTVLSGETLIRVAATGSYAGISKTVTTLSRHEVPPFFKFASLSEGEFKINGERDTIRDAFNTQWNADIHSNTKVTLDLSYCLVKGFVTCSTTDVTWESGKVTISPNQNPNGLAVLRYPVPRVEIPAFDPTAYAGIASPSYGGNMDYKNTTYDLSSDRLNPTIIYVGGKLTLENVTFRGYGVIVAKGDIETIGNVLVDPVDPLGSKLGLYTGEKIMIKSANGTVHAQLFANKEITINDENTKVYGNMIGKSTIYLNAKGVRFYYKPALETLTSPFWLPLTKRLVARHHYE